MIPLTFLLSAAMVCEHATSSEAIKHNWSGIVFQFRVDKLLSASPFHHFCQVLTFNQTTVIDPPTPCDLSDIQGDGGTYTINGITYSVQCNIVPNADRPMALTFVSDFGQYIAACTTTGDCIGVYWDPTDGWDGPYRGLLSELWGPLVSLGGSYVAYLPSYAIQPY